MRRLSVLVIALAVVLGSVTVAATTEVKFTVSHASSLHPVPLNVPGQLNEACPLQLWSGSLKTLPQGLLRMADGTVITEANKALVQRKAFGGLLYNAKPIASGATFPVEDSFLMTGTCDPVSSPKEIQVSISITNAAPMSFNSTLPMYNALPRRLKFRWIDADATNDVVKLTLIKSEGDCTYVHFKEDFVSAPGKPATEEVGSLPKSYVVPNSITGRRAWDAHLNFMVNAPMQTDRSKWIKGDPATDRCKIFYTVTDFHGAVSKVGTVTTVAMSQESDRHVHAYDGTYVARPGRDEYIRLSLRSSAVGGLSNRHFFIDTLPSVGKLYVQGIDGTYNSSYEIKTPGLVDALGRERRRSVRLYYMPPRELPHAHDMDVVIKWKLIIGRLGTSAAPELKNYTSNQATVTINLISSTNQTGPKCGVTTLDPVFAERPFIKIPWNYSLPDGSDVSRIVLYSLPRNPLGDFYATPNSFVLPQDGNFGENLKPMRLGYTFNDRRQQVFFRMKNASFIPKGDHFPPNGILQWFRIRVMNYKRQSCVGMVKVIYRRHDVVAQGDAGKKISAATTGTAIRHEVALAGKYNLLPLRGLANHSLVSQSKIRGVRLVSLPSVGVLQSVLPGAPLLAKMYGTYCRRTDCSKIANATLRAGDEVGRTIFDNDDVNGTPLLRIFYKSSPHLSESQMSAGDSFSYHFIGTAEGKESTWLQQVNIILREGYSQVLHFSYDKPKRVSSRPGQPVAAPQQVYVALKISNKTAGPGGQAVEFRMKNDFKHHYIKKKRFSLYQLKQMDGTMAIPGPAIEVSNKFGSVKRWISDFNNRLVFAPSMHTHHQRFSFRVRIYPLDMKGDADEAVYEEYRVRVTRHNNPPKWDTEEPCLAKSKVNCFAMKNNTVQAGEDHYMFFSVVDLDDDAITFYVPHVPKYGRLDYIQDKPSGQVRRTVRPGHKIRLAHSSTPFKGLIAMIYKHVYNTARFDQYPLKDKFTIYGSDGGAKTKEMEVNLMVVNDGTRGQKKDGRQKRVRDSMAVGIAVMVMLVLLIMAAVVIVKRRQSMKRRYMALPVVSQQQAGVGPGKEMTNKA